ncbi:MAG: hypothetical protein AAF206_20970 [Bacteroidota bacterium]
MNKHFGHPFLPGCLLMLCLGLVSCSDDPKYPEGPDASIYTARQRVTNLWEWSLVLDDNTALTGIYADSTIEFTNDDVVRICDLEGNCREGEWSLVSKRTRLQMIFGRKTEVFDIRMLRKNEMWLRMGTDSSTIDWELRSVETE